MFQQTVLTDAFSVTVKSLCTIYCQCKLSLSGTISQTCTFRMIRGLFIFIAWARFVMINTCSKLIVPPYFVSQSLACVVGNVWTSARLIFSVWLVVHLCCFKFVFCPTATFCFVMSCWCCLFVQSLLVVHAWMFVFQLSLCTVKKINAYIHRPPIYKTQKKGHCYYFRSF